MAWYFSVCRRLPTKRLPRFRWAAKNHLVAKNRNFNRVNLWDSLLPYARLFKQLQNTSIRIEFYHGGDDE